MLGSRAKPNQTKPLITVKKGGRKATHNGLIEFSDSQNTWLIEVHYFWLPLVAANLLF